MVAIIAISAFMTIKFFDLIFVDTAYLDTVLLLLLSLGDHVLILCLDGVDIAISMSSMSVMGESCEVDSRLVDVHVFIIHELVHLLSLDDDERDVDAVDGEEAERAPQVDLAAS